LANGRVEESSEEGEFEEGEIFEQEESDEDEQGSDDEAEEENDILHRITSSTALTNIAELPDIDFGSILEAQRALSKSSLKHPTSSKQPPKSDPPSKPSHNPPKSKPKSKNRPQEVSSKHPVSRKHFLPPPNRTIRDPRFETLSVPDPDEKSLRKEYSFLETYQADEMAALKKQVKQAKSEDERARLRLALQTLRSKGERRRTKDRAEEVLRERAKEEREKIKMGKQPFYLKKSTFSRFVVFCWDADLGR
jgi:ribosomal RNA-processing protein 36